jgi:hypothetical protein
MVVYSISVDFDWGGAQLTRNFAKVVGDRYVVKKLSDYLKGEITDRHQLTDSSGRSWLMAKDKEITPAIHNYTPLVTFYEDDSMWYACTSMQPINVQLCTVYTNKCKDDATAKRRPNKSVGDCIQISRPDKTRCHNIAICCCLERVVGRRFSLVVLLVLMVVLMVVLVVMVVVTMGALRVLGLEARVGEENS